MLCEADEYCSMTHIGKYVMLKVSNGQSVWVYIAKYSNVCPLTSIEPKRQTLPEINVHARSDVISR
jgi:hypothetical protein